MILFIFIFWGGGERSDSPKYRISVIPFRMFCECFFFFLFKKKKFKPAFDNVAKFMLTNTQMNATFTFEKSLRLTIEASESSKI